MSEKGKFTIARYVSHGERFEIVVYPDEALKFKEGKMKDITKVLVYDMVYRDSKKGLRASEDELRRVFGTIDIHRVAEKILKDGELLLTAEQRRKMIEEKRKQVIMFISRNCIDPRTNTPIPPTRIENAMNEAKVSIDPFKSVEEQAMEIVKALRRIIPIKVAKALMAVKIPAQYVGKAYNVLYKMGEIKRESWLPDGTWIAELEIPAGLQPVLIEKVNSLTKGEGEVRLLKSI